MSFSHSSFPTTSFVIRAAAVSDINDLLGMIRALANMSNLDCSVDAGTLRTGLFGAAPPAQALIVEDTRTSMPLPIGFATWHYDFSLFSGASSIVLKDLFLQPSNRGQGIALAFFRALARRAVSEQCESLQWSTVVRNAPMISTYQSLSAIPLANWSQQRLMGQALIAFAAG